MYHGKVLFIRVGMIVEEFMERIVFPGFVGRHPARVWSQCCPGGRVTSVFVPATPTYLCSIPCCPRCSLLHAGPCWVPVTPPVLHTVPH